MKDEHGHIEYIEISGRLTGGKTYRLDGTTRTRIDQLKRQLEEETMAKKKATKKTKAAAMPSGMRRSSDFNRAADEIIKASRKAAKKKPAGPPVEQRYFPGTEKKETADAPR